MHMQRFSVVSLLNISAMLCACSAFVQYFAYAYIVPFNIDTKLIFVYIWYIAVFCCLCGVYMIHCGVLLAVRCIYMIHCGVLLPVRCIYDTLLCFVACTVYIYVE